MLVSIGMFALGLFLLLLGADSMLRGGSGLGQRFGLAPARAGLMLVVFAAMMPALAITATAWAAGQHELALGNAIGGNIVSLGLTLGLAALFAPMLATMRMLGAQLVFVLVASGLVLMFGSDGEIARWEGGALLAGFLAYVVFMFLRGRDEAAEVQKEWSALSVTATGLVQNLVRIAFAGGLLFFGARLVVQHAPLLGSAIGLDPLASGLVLVAIGAALPVLALVAIAARNGQGNVAVGLLLCACLGNLLLMVGGMAALGPLAVPVSLLKFQLPAAMAFVLLLIPLLGGDRKIDRRKGGWLLLAFASWLLVELFIALA